jgi:hypothetical protein
MNLLEIFGSVFIILLSVWFSIWVIWSSMILLFAPYSSRDKALFCALLIFWPIIIFRK